MIHATVQRRYTEALIQKETANWTEGVFALADLPEDLTAERRFGLGAVNGERRRGFSSQFPCAATQAAYTVRVWGGRYLLGPKAIAGRREDLLLRQMFTGALTITPGTASGSTNGVVVADAEELAHEISAPTASPWLAARIAAYGTESPAVFSPGSNGIAELIVPDAGNVDFVAFEFAGTHLTDTGATALVAAED